MYEIYAHFWLLSVEYVFDFGVLRVHSAAADKLVKWSAREWHENKPTNEMK